MAKAKKASKRKSKSKVESKKTSDSESITLTKTNLWQIVSGVLAIILVVVLIAGMNGDSVAPAPGQGNQALPTPTGPSGNVEVSLEGANTLGDENAPVVFVEYSSFSCPFCGNFNRDTFPRIIEEFVETGQVLYVYKHFIRNDLDIVAANAAECAGEQGAFWEYKNQIYENQQLLQSPGFFEGVASDLGLDVSEWQTCFDSERYSDRALQNRNEGISNGIQGTPGFVIDGTPFTRGAVPFEAFAQEINRALN
ncbi:MAG: DsbA family protein [Candidatus Woesearchaeota archaeon]